MKDKVHLDTHVALWIAAGQAKRLSNASVNAFDQARERCISPMVWLEIQYLFEIKRISTEPERIISYLQQDQRVGLDATSWTQVVETAVGYVWTRDPFDRLIVANAVAADATILTRDETILAQCKHALRC